MKFILTQLRIFSEELKKTQYAPLILFFFVVCIWLLPSYKNPPQQPKTITITVTLSDADLIIKGLNELPYKESAGLIQNVISQAQKQLASDTTKIKK